MKRTKKEASDFVFNQTDKSDLFKNKKQKREKKEEKSHPSFLVDSGPAEELLDLEDEVEQKHKKSTPKVAKESNIPPFVRSSNPETRKRIAHPYESC